MLAARKVKMSSSEIKMERRKIFGSAAPRVDFIVIPRLNPVHLKPRWPPVRECS